MSTTVLPMRGRRRRSADAAAQAADPDAPIPDAAPAGADETSETGDAAGAGAALPPPGASLADPPPPDVRVIPLGQLHESPLNARRRFDAQKLAELADSLRATGQLSPLLVRPSSLPGRPGFEIASGHRRRRAAPLAGLAGLLAIVRELTDQEFLEILTIENLQREDVHPLEEAQGYAELIKSAGYDVAKIAARIGMSSHYVRDRLKLLNLVAPARQLFLEGTITAGHAVLISRLTVDDQERVLGDDEESPLFEHERVLEHPELELPDTEPRKPISVRELEAWIDQHVRFDEAHVDVQEFFPATAATVTAAEEQEEKIIKITHEHYIQPEARTEGERTFGPRSWTRADGLHGSKPCEYSVTGVIAIGPGRGEAFKVCIDKKHCTVHWKEEVKAAAQRAKAKTAGESESSTTKGSTSAAKAQARQAADQRKWEEERKREEEAEALWKRCVPDIATAIAAKVKKASAGANSALADIVLSEVVPYGGAAAATKYVGRGSSTEDLVRHAAFILLYSDLTKYRAHKEFPKIAKTIGVDVAAILKAKASNGAKPAAKTGKKARRV
jgi:ParB/RepB/Spo0J family partition protein